MLIQKAVETRIVSCFQQMCQFMHYHILDAVLRESAQPDADRDVFRTQAAASSLRAGVADGHFTAPDAQFLLPFSK